MEVSMKNKLENGKFAVYPQLWEGRSPWMLYSLELHYDGTLKWKKRYFKEGKFSRAQVFESFDEAMDFSEDLNKNLDWSNYKKQYTKEYLDSLILKVEKAKACKKRLLSEEQMMLSEAIKRGKGDKYYHIDDSQFIEIPEGEFKEDFVKYLNDYPYVKIVALPRYSGVVVN